MPQTSASAAQPPFVDLELSWISGTSSLPSFLGTGWRLELISFRSLPEGRPSFFPLSFFRWSSASQSPISHRSLRVQESSGFLSSFPQSLFRARQSLAEMWHVWTGVHLELPNTQIQPKTSPVGPQGTSSCSPTAPKPPCLAGRAPKRLSAPIHWPREPHQVSSWLVPEPPCPETKQSGMNHHVYLELWELQARPKPQP